MQWLSGLYKAKCATSPHPWGDLSTPGLTKSPFTGNETSTATEGNLHASRLSVDADRFSAQARGKCLNIKLIMNAFTPSKSRT